MCAEKTFRFAPAENNPAVSDKVSTGFALATTFQVGLPRTLWVLAMTEKRLFQQPACI